MYQCPFSTLAQILNNCESVAICSHEALALIGALFESCVYIDVKIVKHYERHSRFLLNTCSKCNSRYPHKSHNTALCHQLDDISEESHETALSGTDER